MFPCPLASAELPTPERSKKILVPKKSRGTLDTVGQDLNFNFPELDENDVMDDLENDVVTFYVQQVLRLGRKTHATLEAHMDKSVVICLQGTLGQGETEWRRKRESLPMFCIYKI